MQSGLVYMGFLFCNVIYIHRVFEAGVFCQVFNNSNKASQIAVRQVISVATSALAGVGVRMLAMAGKGARVHQQAVIVDFLTYL